MAVSRHIRELEAELGVGLFARDKNAVRVTAAGAELLSGVGRGLLEIQRAIEGLRVRATQATVRLGMTSAVFEFWMAPVIEAFRKECPDVDLRIAVVEQGQDLSVAEFDLAIRFDPEAAVGVRRTHLCDEEVAPICAPAYLAGRQRFAAVADLASADLLDLDHPYRPVTTWRHWFETHDAAPRDVHPRITFNLYSSYVHAALNGQGVALLGAPIVRRALAARALVRASAFKPIRTGGFYLLRRKARFERAVDALEARILESAHSKT